MKIGSFDSHNKPPAPAGGNPPTTTAGAPASAAAAPDASTKVELSPAASLHVNEGNADFDAQKVDRIAQAIRAGNFKVNAEAIASRLIAHTQELLSGRRRH